MIDKEMDMDKAYEIDVSRAENNESRYSVCRSYSRISNCVNDYRIYTDVY